MSLIARRRKRQAAPERQRFSLDQLIQQINYLGHNYPAGLIHQTGLAGDREEPDSAFTSIVQHAYRDSGPVFACILARAMLFSEARFQWQEVRGGRPGRLFGNADLAILEQPWPNGTTGELLWRAEQDTSLAGNFYLRRHRNRLWRLRPDYMTILIGSQMEVDDPADAIDAEVIGYLWRSNMSAKVVPLLPEEVAHWSPIPDPLANYRGMSWLTPVLREIGADTQAVVHKQRFFENGATPNLVIMPDATVSYDEFKEFRDDFQDQHEGAWNAYKTLFLGGGSKVEKVGLGFAEMDYSNLQGNVETRIAAAANVPPIIAGFSEGLESATYSNYGQARRKFGDHFARPQWRSCAASIAKLLPPQTGGTRLWYDDRDIPFLREDTGDEANIRQTDAITIRQLVEVGFEPDAAVAAVLAGDFSVLEGEHTGLTSVQLTPPGSGDEGDAGGEAGAEGGRQSGDDGGLEDVDGIDPLEMATLLQRLYLATPDKVVVTTGEARELARKAGLDIPEDLPPELEPNNDDPEVDDPGQADELEDQGDDAGGE